MKIRKLELCNIASIEKAVIDFDTIPLCDTDLFLITGTTGAGKTTILDGISLALYNTTPRIAKGMTRKEGANTDDLTGDDPRNIMRLNTGYAYSRLFFQGNDREEYCAEWSVERGKQRRVTGKLSNVTWTVKKLGSTEQVTGDNSRKYSEVEEYVRKIVGLDFHQFCRTTMLAQGEFTEFLKSDEKDKAAILEKISGSGIYRKIGAEIFRQSQNADKLFEAEDNKRNQIIVMDADEREAKENELQTIDVDLPKLQAEIDNLIKCINWLTESGNAERKMNEAGVALETAKNTVNSEEFLTTERDVQQWNETIEARQSRRNALNEQRKAEDANHQLERLEKSFAEALAGEAYLVAAQTVLEAQVRDLQAAVKAEMTNAEAYTNCQTIVAHIKSLQTAFSEKKTKEEARKNCEDIEIPEAQKVLADSTEKLIAAQTSFEATQKELEEIKATLASLNLNGLRNEKEFLDDLKRKKEKIKELADKITEEKKSIANDESELVTLEAISENEKAELYRLKIEHERRKETIDKFAKEMRSKLSAHLGEEDNICPVCGQHVASIQSNDLLDQEYKQIEKEYKAQEAIATTAATNASQKANIITLAKKKLSELISKHEAEVEAVQEKVGGREDAQKLIDASEADILEFITAISVKITAGIEIEKQQQTIQDRYNQQLKAKGAAESKQLADANSVNNALGKLERLNDEICRKEETIIRLKESIRNSLEGSIGWEYSWDKNPDDFTTELNSRAKAFGDKQKAISEAQTKIAANGPVLTNIIDLKKEILEAMPNWSTDNVEPAGKKNLQKLWTDLNADVKAQKQALISATDEGKKFAKAVQEFLDSHPGYSIERLYQLENISREAYENDSRYVNDCRNAVKTRTDLFEAAKTEWDDHINKKPESLQDVDTIETLEVRKTDIEGKKDELNVRKGALEKEIEDDNKAKIKKEDTTLLDQLRAEKEKWNRFNSVYGDATGSHLCKIAQSYVLGSLINSANVHLKGMAPQYRLLVTEGTLNLKLEDKYNGYATRSTNSISGGESFLVSLALALALADFGQHLGVSTLFIDEGFGTLSGEALQSAINTLKALHSSAGRQVGIISHREEIRDNIPVQIKVTATNGSSASTVTAGQYLNGTFIKAE